MESEAVADTVTGVFNLAETYFDRLPNTSRVDPEGLTTSGADQENILELRDPYWTFRAGGEQLLPLLPVQAATVSAAGEGDALTLP